MKDNSEMKKRLGKYGVILAVMFAAAVASTVMLWWSSAKYRGQSEQEIIEQAGISTLDYEIYALNDLASNAQDASFGFYYLMKKKDVDYNISPSDIYWSDGVFDEAETNMNDDSDYTAEEFSSDASDPYFESQINQYVESEYYNFLNYISMYGMEYYVEDLTNSKNYISSINDPNLNAIKKKQSTAPFYMELKINSDGMVQVAGIDNNFSAGLEGIELWNTNLKERIYDNGWDGYGFSGYPKSMKIYLYSDNTSFYDNVYSEVYHDSYYSNRASMMDHMALLILFIGVVIVAAAWILFSSKKMGLREGFITKIPFEIVVCIGIAAILYFAVIGAECTSGFVHPDNNSIMQAIPCIIGMLAAYFGAEILIFLAAGGIYALAILGPKKYIKERTIFWCCIRWIKNKLVKVYHEALHLVFEAKNNKTLLKVVIINGVIVALICCFWFAGIFGVIIYSILIFAIGLDYLKKLQRQYDVVHKAARDMAEGRLNTDMSGDAGAFEPIRQDLAKVRDGVKIAVEEEVKSQKMKTELITNVSHDLKTPLTAIITYTNLLKDEKLSEDDRRKYVDILDKKADRLKRLIEDLFEVSKANSGNIKINKTWLDVADLVRQATIENEDKLKNASIDLRLSLPLGKTMLELDGQKMYRIMDNLLGNVAKYSLAGTRAYVAVADKGSKVIITVKNISASELPEDVSSLTERFVRGDESRHTEGSGLGLAIVKSFTELMGGTFDIRVDGDLFKATVTFERAEAEKEKMAEMYAPLDTTIEEADLSISEAPAAIFYKEPKIKMSEELAKSNSEAEIEKPSVLKGQMAETVAEKINTEEKEAISQNDVVNDETVKLEDVLNMTSENEEQIE